MSQLKTLDAHLNPTARREPIDRFVALMLDALDIPADQRRRTSLLLRGAAHESGLLSAAEPREDDARETRVEEPRPNSVQNKLGPNPAEAPENVEESGRKGLASDAKKIERETPIDAPSQSPKRVGRGRPLDERTEERLLLLESEWGKTLDEAVKHSRRGRPSKSGRKRTPVDRRRVLRLLRTVTDADIEKALAVNAVDGWEGCKWPYGIRAMQIARTERLKAERRKCVELRRAEKRQTLERQETERRLADEPQTDEDWKRSNDAREGLDLSWMERIPCKRIDRDRHGQRRRMAA